MAPVSLFAAMTGFGLGTWSLPVSAKPRVERVTAPRNVNAIRTPRAVTVTWQAPAVGVPLRYVVLASINGKPFRLVRTTTTTRSTFGVKATVRTVRVQVLAVDTYGQGPRTSPIRPR